MQTGGIARSIPPREYKRHVEALDHFRARYEEYLAAPSHSEEETALRRAVMELAPAADAALALVGLRPAILDRGGPTIHGLVNVAFADESAFLPVPAVQSTLDTLAAGVGALEERRKREVRRRRNPLYWLDRLLRVLLGIPAYLISLVFRVPPERIEDSLWGTALRAFSFVVEVGLLVLGLHEWFGWF